MSSNVVDRVLADACNSQLFGVGEDESVDLDKAVASGENGMSSRSF